MKTTRRILSMLLVLMMVLSLSVNAFATGTDTATVTIKVNGTAVDSNTFIPENQSVFTYLSGTYTAVGNDYWYEFTDLNGNQAYALLKLTVNGTTYTSGAADGPTSGITGVQWSTTRAGYGFEGFAYNDDGEIIGYKYIYVGNDFVYTVTNGGNTVDVSDKYMNQYTIQPGDNVEVNFGLVVSRWTASNPFEPNAPYI